MNLTSSHDVDDDDDMPGQQQLLQLDKRSDPLSSAPPRQTARRTDTYVMQQGVCATWSCMFMSQEIFALNGAGSRNSNKAKEGAEEQQEEVEPKQKKARKLADTLQARAVPLCASKCVFFATWRYPAVKLGRFSLKPKLQSTRLLPTVCGVHRTSVFHRNNSNTKYSRTFIQHKPTMASCHAKQIKNVLQISRREIKK